MNGAIARIILRYGVGLVLGMKVGDMLAADPDLVMMLSLGVAAAIEYFYAKAKKEGGSL